MSNKLLVYRTNNHDHCVAYLNGEEIISNDYSMENVYRLAKHLKWEVEIVSLSGDEFEKRFA